jgi:hypothetical protein
MLIWIPDTKTQGLSWFEAIFRSIPNGKLNCAYVEIGEWDRQSDSYPWEGQVILLLGPDDQVWAKIGDLVDIPDEK